MKVKNLQSLLDILKEGNPNNINLNHTGLHQIGKILFYPTAKQENDKIELLKLIKNYYGEEDKKVLESLRTFHFTSFYTSKDIIIEQLDFLQKNNFIPNEILEPSAGNGAYVIELAKKFPLAKITALEPDIFSFHTLSSSTQHLPNVVCINSRFENFYLNNTKTFDLIISNIPFGSLNIENAYKHKNLNNNLEKNVNVFFNKYSLELLNEKGIALILTSKQFADNNNYSPIREEILKKNDLLDIIRFSNDLFSSEKTKVVTDLIIYQNNSTKTQLSKKEILFYLIEF